MAILTNNYYIYISIVEQKLNTETAVPIINAKYSESTGAPHYDCGQMLTFSFSTLQYTAVTAATK